MSCKIVVINIPLFLCVYIYIVASAYPTLYKLPMFNIGVYNYTYIHTVHAS